MKTHKFILIYITIIISSLLVTTYLLHKQTKSRSNASRSTTLLLPVTTTANIGQTVSLDVSLDPGNNQVSIVKLVVDYDSSKIIPTNDGFVAGTIPGTNPPIPWGAFEKPSYNNCSGTQCNMSVTYSVGNDFTKAVTMKTFLAQINFKALSPTDSNGTQIRFDSSTQVFSIGPNDSSNENVLLAANPGTIIIQDQQITITPTTSPIIPSTTITPSPSVTPPIATSETPTETLRPSDTVSTTPTLIPVLSISPNPSQEQMTGRISVHFEGIDADNTLNPNHPQRLLQLYFFKTNDFSVTPDANISTYVAHITGDGNGTFSNPSIDLSTISPGRYYILAKSPEGSLREQVSPNLISIIQGQNTLLNSGASNLSIPNLRMGDFNNDNSIDINDYNIFVDCFTTKQTAPSCLRHSASDSTKGFFTDINDDGIVNGIDYNLLIRHFGEKGY